MKFWPRNILKTLTNEEDKAFLRSMMTDRKASMAGIDKLSINKAKRKATRNNEAKKTKWRRSSMFYYRSIKCTDTSTDDESIAHFSPPEVTRKHKRSVKTGINVHIPSDILKAPNVVQALVCNKISSTAISAVMHEIIMTADGDPSKLSLSYTSAKRYRLEAVQTISEKIAENWTILTVANLHWDGKLMDTLDGSTKIERLLILLSGIWGTKLLGVPAFPHKSSTSAGSLIAKASDELIKIWDCKNSLSGVVFDTTCSNTGAQTAACIALQNTISKLLLWFACHHHVGEVVLTHVWNKLQIEALKSPEISVFQRFKQFFPSIPSTSENLDYLNIPETLSERKEEIVDLCHNYLKRFISRGDYKELVKLTLLYLGDHTTKTNFAALNRPGALHKARWMSKLLYSIKMSLLGSSISNNLKGNKNLFFTFNVWLIQYFH